MNWNPWEVFFKRLSSFVSNNNKLNRSSIWKEAQMRIHSNPIQEMNLCSDHVPVYSLLHRFVMVCWHSQLAKGSQKICISYNVDEINVLGVQKHRSKQELKHESKRFSPLPQTWIQAVSARQVVPDLQQMLQFECPYVPVQHLWQNTQLDMISNNANCNSRLLRAWRTPTRCMLIVLTLKDERTLDALPKSGITKMFSKGEYKEYSTLY